MASHAKATAGAKALRWRLGTEKGRESKQERGDLKGNTR